MHGVLLATPRGPRSLVPPAGPHTSCSAVPGLIRLILLSHPREPPPTRPRCLQGRQASLARQTSLLWPRWEFYRPAAEAGPEMVGLKSWRPCPSRSPDQPPSEHACVAARSGRGLQALVGGGGWRAGPAGHLAPSSALPHLPTRTPHSMCSCSSLHLEHSLQIFTWSQLKCCLLQEAPLDRSP